MDVANKMMLKAEVCERLGVSDRTLEKMVRANEFPNPLRHGKWLRWSQEAVERWLRMALEPQLNWEPTRKRAIRKAGTAIQPPSAVLEN